MRSTLLVGCLIWAVACVHSLTRVERPFAIHKRAASPQVNQPQPSNSWNQTQQFQWVKVNNQWVRRDGTKLPGYSQANVPYNQTANQWNTPTPSRSPTPTQPQRPGNQSAPNVGWGQQPAPQGPQQAPQPRRQNSTSSQGGVGWNPAADRALTQDLPQTTPRPVYTTTTTQRPVIPQTPPPAYRPPAATPPINAPFGSGVSGPQTPPGSRPSWNPDASLTYGIGGRSPPTDRTRTPQNPNTGRTGSNPWGGLFNRLI